MPDHLALLCKRRVLHVVSERVAPRRACPISCYRTKGDTSVKRNDVLPRHVTTISYCLWDATRRADGLESCCMQLCTVGGYMHCACSGTADCPTSHRERISLLLRLVARTSHEHSLTWQSDSGLVGRTGGGLPCRALHILSQRRNTSRRSFTGSAGSLSHKDCHGAGFFRLEPRRY